MRAQSAMDDSDDDVLSDEAFHAPARQAPRSALKLNKLSHTPVPGSGPTPSATPSKTPLRQLPQHAARAAPSPEPARCVCVCVCVCVCARAWPYYSKP